MHKGFLCRVDDIKSSQFFPPILSLKFISSINIVHYACWYKCHRIIKSSLTIFILYKPSFIYSTILCISCHVLCVREMLTMNL